MIQRWFPAYYIFVFHWEGDLRQVRAKKVLFGADQGAKRAHCWMGTADGRLFIIELEEPFTQIYSRHLTDRSETPLSFHASIGATNCWYALQISRQCLVTLLCNEHIIHSVLQILHVEPHVFVSLHNGALVVYTRDKQGLWDMENYQLIVIDTTGENYHLFLLFRYLDTTYSLPDYHLCRGIWRMGITTVRYFPRMRIFLALWVVLVSTN